MDRENGHSKEEKMDSRPSSFTFNVDQVTMKTPSPSRRRPRVVGDEGSRSLLYQESPLTSLLPGPTETAPRGV